MKAEPNAAYWEKRLSSDFSMAMVGDRRLGLAYNSWLYRARLRALDRMLDRLKLNVEGKSVLDLGCGTGFYVSYWLEKGARSVTGVDITDVSVTQLRERFPRCEFLRRDIGSEDLVDAGTFDVVSAFDVLFHITSEEGFTKALANIRSCCHQGTYVLLSDYFPDEEADLGQQERHVSRTHYDDLLASNGLEQRSTAPVFYLMTSPLPREGNAALHALWWLTFRALRGSRRIHLNSIIGHALGAPLYLIDGVLTHARWGPNTKLMALRYRGEGHDAVEAPDCTQ